MNTVIVLVVVLLGWAGGMEISGTPIIGSVIGIGPIMRFLGNIGIGKFYR